MSSKINIMSTPNRSHVKTFTSFTHISP